MVTTRQQFLDENATRKLPVLDYAIGVASGAVLAGELGTDKLRFYDVLGQPVNQAFRVCALATRRGVSNLVDAATWEGVKTPGRRPHGHRDRRGRARRRQASPLQARRVARPVQGPFHPSRRAGRRASRGRRSALVETVERRARPRRRRRDGQAGAGRAGAGATGVVGQVRDPGVGRGGRRRRGDGVRHRDRRRRAGRSADAAAGGRRRCWPRSRQKGATVGRRRRGRYLRDLQRRLGAARGRRSVQGRARSSSPSCASPTDWAARPTSSSRASRPTSRRRSSPPST